VSDVDARTWGRIGGLTAWARNDAETMTGAAHRGFRAKFAAIVDPEGRLDPQERAVRADRLMRAHMLTLAARSAASRKKKAGPVTETVGTGREDRRGHHHAEPRPAA
jgi:hypothetical protein